jgi:hypothetical protein
MAQGLLQYTGALLANSSGQLIGAMGPDGREYLLPVAPNSSASTTAPAAIYNSSVSFTGGTMNGVVIGGTTRSSAAFTFVQVSATDSTSTPGNVTNGSTNGRAAFSAGTSSVVVTNGSVVATDTVLITLLGAADATLLYITGVTVAAGSFTVTGNANATAIKGFMFSVIKA